MKVLTSILLLFFLGCNSKAQGDKEKIDSLIQLALKADSVDDYKTSILYYNEILSADSLNLLSLNNRGKALIASSKTEEGIADLSKAVKHYPHEETYYSRAVAYMYLNKLDSAKNDLDKATTLNALSADKQKERKKFMSKLYYAYSNLHFMKGEYLSTLVNCEMGDLFGINPAVSSSLKSELGKILGNNVVMHFNNDSIFSIVKNLPDVKKANEKSLAENEYGLSYGMKLIQSPNWIYIITVSEGKKEKVKWVYKIDAATLKIVDSK
jgi:tetratricopeptide (TPR) repeat protein